MGHKTNMNQMRGLRRVGAVMGMLAAFLAGQAVDAQTEPSLGAAFAGRFEIGFGTDRPGGARADLVRRHASTLTSENCLKPRTLRPDAQTWDWEKGDAWLAFSEELGARPVGHTLVWCYNMPKWLLADIEAGTLDKAGALAWQDAHIRAVVGRYGPRIPTWDVVNEALADGPGEALLRKDAWSDLCGVDYVVEAFRSARAAAPEARLLYNDYGLEFADKRARLLRLLATLKEAGVRVDGVGIQGHLQLSKPRVAELEAAIVEIHAAGYPVHITELDVDVYTRGEGADVRRMEAGVDKGYAELPAELSERQARAYGELFRMFVRHADKVERVTFWNVDDGNSWLNFWPVRGRRNHPLLFDRDQKPKAAFWAVIEAAGQSGHLDNK